MLKKIFVFFIVMFILTGCSKEEKVWKKEYLNVVNNWEKEKGKDVLGYDFIFLDEDEIPELVLYCNDDAYIGFDMYTIYNEKAKKLELVDRFLGYKCYQNATLTSHGRQMQADDYDAGTGLYIRSYRMAENYWEEGYFLQDGVLWQVYNYNEYPWIHMDGAYEYEVSYNGSIYGWNNNYNSGVFLEMSDFHRQFEEYYGVSYKRKKSLLDESNFLSYREALQYLAK